MSKIVRNLTPGSQVSITSPNGGDVYGPDAVAQEKLAALVAHADELLALLPQETTTEETTTEETSTGEESTTEGETTTAE